MRSATSELSRSYSARAFSYAMRARSTASPSCMRSDEMVNIGAPLASGAPSTSGRANDTTPDTDATTVVSSPGAGITRPLATITSRNVPAVTICTSTPAAAAFAAGSEISPAAASAAWSCASASAA